MVQATIATDLYARALELQQLTPDTVETFSATVYNAEVIEGVRVWAVQTADGKQYVYQPSDVDRLCWLSVGGSTRYDVVVENLDVARIIHEKGRGA